MLTRSYFDSRNKKQRVVALNKQTKSKTNKQKNRQKKKITSMGEDVDELQSLYIVGGM